MSKESELDINSIKMEMSATTFLWEENFDLKLLEVSGIIVNTSNKSVYCSYCNCFLPELSSSKNSNICNIKLHVISYSHKLRSLKCLNKLDLRSILSTVNHVEVAMPSNDIKLSKSQLNVLINLDCKKLSGENTTEWLFSATRQLINTNFKGIFDDMSDFQLNRSLFTINNKQIYCNLCNWELSKNLKFVITHLEGWNHSNLFIECFLDEKNPLRKFFDILQLNTDSKFGINEVKQIFYVLKENDLYSKYLISSKFNNLLSKENVDQVFQAIEEYLKKIDYIKQNDFNTFGIHRNSILFTNNKIRGYCKMCEKYFSSTNNFMYRRLMEHICTKKHLNKLKKLLSANENKIEYNILVWLKKKVAIKYFLNDKNLLSKFFNVPQMNADSQLRTNDVKQILETLKIDDQLCKFLFNNSPEIDECQNQLSKKHVCQFFQAIEENLKKVDCIKLSDFNSFEIHRNVILFTNNMVKGYCTMCEKYFISTKNCILSYSLMEHICGQNHLKKLQGLLSGNKSNIEYKILVWLKEQIKKKEKNICTYLF